MLRNKWNDEPIYELSRDFVKIPQNNTIDILLIE